ncbi:hypothetical protein SMICM17S_01060 [Streptomyces microflavus]
MALEVDAHHRVPVVLVQVDEHPVAQEARVVDQGVEAAEGVQGGGDQGGGALGGGDVAVVDDRFAAPGRDLLDDPAGGSARASVAAGPDAEVVDDDPGSFGGEGERVGPAEAASGARDGDDPARAESGSSGCGHLISRVRGAGWRAGV